MSEKKPIGAWKAKLEALQLAEASAADPAKKFELAQEIAEAKEKIAELENGGAAAKSKAADSPPLYTATPNNLPRLQPFFGREKELAAIREALDPESRTWGALIDGPGGMGKTSLAVRAAYDCPPGQFQRIIFLSVKDREMDDDGERKLTGFI